MNEIPKQCRLCKHLGRDFTQDDLNAAIAKAVEERTRECYEIARVHIAPAHTIFHAFPECFKDEKQS